MVYCYYGIVQKYICSNLQKNQKIYLIFTEEKAEKYFIFTRLN